jgi:peptide-methionine (S)-S-oxide reductase
MSEAPTKLAKQAAYFRSSVTITVLAIFAGFGFVNPGSAAEVAHVIPAPAADAQAATDGQATSEMAVLAGGCFWGVQGVFQHVSGVTSAVSGYAGGEKNTAHYEMVGSGRSGHAESVRVTFDPRKISYGRVLQIYFSVAHDPTQLNRQGPDVGTQYRSAIFPVNAAIVTKIEPAREFYAAEDYHQDYMTLHPTQPYIVYNDLPKIDDLKTIFPDLYRADPVLVASRPSN